MKSVALKLLLVVIPLIVLTSKSLGQLCPGRVVGIGTASAATCEEAEKLAREAAILDADAKCLDHCIFTIVPDVEYAHTPTTSGGICTVKYEVIHKCISRSNDDDDPKPPVTPPSGISLPVKILAGVGAVLLGIVAVVLVVSPIPGDEVVVGAGAAALAGAAVGS